MSTFVHKIQRWLEETSGAKLNSSTPAGGNRQRIFVTRTPRPYWEESGWRRDSGNYIGEYRTLFGKWNGYVSVSPSGRVDVYIYEPPAALQRHPHWTCFNPFKEGWYLVHPTAPVKDVSAGIISVEKTINEAYAL